MLRSPELTHQHLNRDLPLQPALFTRFLNLFRSPDTFYQYAIPVRHRAELEKAVDSATPGSSELRYAPGFLRRLDHWESEAKGGRTYYVAGFGLIGEADLGRFIPNFSQFITMAGQEEWQDAQIGDTFEGTAFNKPVRLMRRS